MASIYSAGMFLFVAHYVILSRDVKANKLPNLTVMGCLPMTGANWYGGGALLPPSLMALDIVNAREDILSGYTLQFVFKDCMCDAGVAVDATYAMLYTPPVKHFITGPGCSVAAEAVASSTHMWNLTHLSWGGASPMLSDKTRFPRFYRVGAPDTRFNVARLALLRHFNWKKIALINVAMDFFFSVADDFLQLVKTAPDIEIISQEIFNRDPMQRIQYLKSKDARIILGGGYENHARAMLCAAYRVGLYGPKVVWMFPGWFADHWWRSALDDLPCTSPCWELGSLGVPMAQDMPKHAWALVHIQPARYTDLFVECGELLGSEQMDEAAEGHMLTGFSFYHRDVEERGVSGINVREFWHQFRHHPLYRPELANFEFLSGHTFDSVFGAALALNCTDSYLKQIGHVKALSDFQYLDGDIGDIITECAHNLTFLGISGHLDLSKGDSIKSIKLEQIYNSEKRLVSIYNHRDDNHTRGWHIDWIDGGIIWRGGHAPRDSTQVTILEVTVPIYLYVLMSTLASFGILLSSALIVFNVLHRKHIFVKLSSPNINSIMLLGCICTYSTVFMHSCTGENTVLCKIRAFTLTLGFSTAFGAMFSKTWRVYRIFANKKLLRVKLHDSQLIGIVGALVAVLATILVIHEIVDPLVMETQFLETEVYTNGNDAEIRPYIRKCVSRYQSYFSWTVYFIEGVLLVFGAFLSFETRKVRIAALNDSHQIGLCLYNVIAVATVGLTLSLALDTHIGLVYGAVSGFIILGTTATQLIVFIPKIMAVYYPHRVQVAQNATYNTVDGSRAGPETSTSYKLTARPSGSVNCSGTIYTIDEHFPDNKMKAIS